VAVIKRLQKIRSLWHHCSPLPFGQSNLGHVDRQKA